MRKHRETECWDRTGKERLSLNLGHPGWVSEEVSSLQHPDWEEYRREFPIFHERRFINSCSKGALSVRVYRAIAQYLDTWKSAGSPWESQWVTMYNRVRELMAGLLGATPDEVGLVPSVSAALSALASALDFSHRNRIVTTTLDFPTVGHVWLGQQKRGAEVVFVDPADDPNSGGRITSELLREAVDDRTLVVSVPLVSYRTGGR